MEQLRARYNGANTASGHVINAECDEATGQLALWWIETKGRQTVTYPITVIMKPRAGSYEVTSFVDAEPGKTRLRSDLAAACDAINEQIRKH